MRPWRVACLSLSVIGLFEVSYVAGAQATITIGPTIQVSRADQSFEHDELLACADPHRPDHLMVGSIVNYMDRFHPWTTAYVSFDGGRTWEVGVEDRPPADSEISEDPACAYGPDGTAYFAALDVDGNDVSYFYRSPDGGKKWLPHSTIFRAFDRPYIAIDATGGRYNSRIYVGHNGPGGIALQRSLDGGQTFYGPVLRPVLTTDRGDVPAIQSTPNPGNTVVLSTGTLVSLLYERAAPTASAAGGRDWNVSLKLVRSTDGGQHYKDEVKIADYTVVDEGSSHLRDGVLHTPPNIAVDPGSSLFKDRLYAVWQTDVEDQETKRVREESVISYSVDEGTTWSSPRPIENNEPIAITSRPVREYQTTVGVNKDGVVGVMWYEGFETDRTQGYWVRFAASLDGGETWTPSVRVSQAPCTFGVNESLPMTGKVDQKGGEPLNLHVWSFVRLSSGDTGGLVADAGGVFHVFWIGSCGGASQVWTAPVTVSGAVQRTGASELADLDDLSGKVHLTLTHTTFEPRSGKIAATLALTNVSEQTIRGPLKLRVLMLRSDVGTPEVLHSATGVLRDGAIVDLSEVLHGGVLKPGAPPVEIGLGFKIADPILLRSEGRWHIGGEWGILTLRGRLFGRT